jgi:hypothetical protein
VRCSRRSKHSTQNTQLLAFKPVTAAVQEVKAVKEQRKAGARPLDIRDLTQHRPSMGSGASALKSSLGGMQFGGRSGAVVGLPSLPQPHSSTEVLGFLDTSDWSFRPHNPNDMPWGMRGKVPAQRIVQLGGGVALALLCFCSRMHASWLGCCGLGLGMPCSRRTQCIRSSQCRSTRVIVAHFASSPQQSLVCQDRLWGCEQTDSKLVPRNGQPCCSSRVL